MYRKAAIVGIGHTDYSKNSGRTDWQLALQAVLPGLQDAQVDPSEVDGIVRYSYDAVTPAMLVRSLGIRDLRFFADIPFGGTASAAVVAQAAGAIASGQASVVVIYRSLNERSGVRYGRAERNIAVSGTDTTVATSDRSPAGAFSGPYGLLSPGQVMATWARRYMYVNDMTDDDLSRCLGTVAVQQRQYANTNPDAMMRDRKLDMATYADGRMISTPLRLYDYCLESDGAAAAVLVSADRARSTRSDAAYVLSGAQSLTPHSEPISVYMRDVLEPVPRPAIDRLYDDARIAPTDIDVVQLYDATSVMVPMGLEAYGLAHKGSGWKHVLDHGIGIGSPVPVNTHGGHLSESYVHGMNHVVEAVRQLRGTAANQVQDAQHVLFGCSGASSVILGRG